MRACAAGSGCQIRSHNSVESEHLGSAVLEAEGAGAGNFSGTEYLIGADLLRVTEESSIRRTLSVLAVVGVDDFDGSGRRVDTNHIQIDQWQIGLT